MLRRLRTIDAHTAGEPLRLVVDGFAIPAGRTMPEKRAWLKKHADALRRALLQPGRGDEIAFDSPAGLVRARPRIESRPTVGDEPGQPATAGAVPASRVSSVAFTNVPSFVYEAGVTVKLQTRALRADIAFAGAFYAIVDAEAAGVGIESGSLPAVLDAMSLLPASRPLVQESLIGTVFQARVIGRESVGGCDAIVPEVEGSAWITGEHEFPIDDEDPLREGFRA